MDLTFLKKKIIVIPVGILLLLTVVVVAIKVKYSKQWCSSSWGTPFQVAHGNIAFPDEQAAYWVRFLSDSQTRRHIGFKIHGQFAHARYESFAAYSHTDRDVIVNASLDREIVPDTGSSNPFVPGTARDIAKRSYTLWWIPEGSHAPAEAHNVLTYRAGSPSQLIIRIYAPDAGRDITGGVGLPTVTLYDLRTAAEMPCTRDLTLGIGDLLPWKDVEKLVEDIPSRPANPPGSVHFWAEHTGNFALYQNPDNDYLTTFLDNPRLGRDVVVLRFKPPTVPDTKDGKKPFTGSAQVRYWSMCMGGISSRTSSCLADSEVVIGNDGLVTIVVTDAPDVKRHAHGANILPWGHQAIPVLIYRNLATERNGSELFPGDLKRVPPPEPGKNPLDFVADRFIGHYAPTGVQCTSEEFLRNYCGVKMPDAQ